MGVYTSVYLDNGVGVQFKHGDDWLASAKLGSTFNGRGRENPPDGIYFGIGGASSNALDWQSYLVAVKGGVCVACDLCELPPTFEPWCLDWKGTPELAKLTAQVAELESKFGVKWTECDL